MEEKIFTCNICNIQIETDNEDCDEDLWGHMQKCHNNTFQQVQDYESPHMIEKYFKENNHE